MTFMDEPISLPAIMLGTILVIIYAIRCARSKQKTQVGTAVLCYLYSGGIVASVLIFLSSCFPSLRPKIAHFELYITIGAIAVLFVVVPGLWQGVVSSTRSVKKQSSVDKDNHGGGE